MRPKRVKENERADRLLKRKKNREEKPGREREETKEEKKNRVMYHYTTNEHFVTF